MEVTAKINDMKNEGGVDLLPLVPVPELSHTRISRVKIRKRKLKGRKHGSLLPVVGKEESLGPGPAPISIPKWRRLIFNRNFWLVFQIFMVIGLACLCGILLYTNWKQDAIIKALIEAQMENHREWTTTRTWNDAVGKWVTVSLGFLKTVGLAAYLYVNPFGPVVLI